MSGRSAVQGSHRAVLGLSGRRLYDALARTLLGRATSCRLTGAYSAKDIQRVFDLVMCDEPAVFGVDSLRIRALRAETVIMPDYTLGGDEYMRELSRCAQSAESLLKNCGGSCEYHAALAVHDALLRGLRYSDDGTRSVHSIVAPLTKGYGVCEGIAKTFQYLLQRQGVPCVPVYGTLHQSEGGAEKHVWNMVCFNGRWAHIDVTRDMALTEGGVPRRDYFAVSSRQMGGEHDFDESAYPPADSEKLEFYSASGLVMSRKSELTKTICARLRAGERSVVFRLPDNVPEQGAAEKVSAVAQSALRDINFCGSYELRYNLDRRVFELTVGGGRKQ